MFWHHVRPNYLLYFGWSVIYITDELMNKNDTEKLVIFVAALIYYYGGRFICVVRIIRVASSENEPSFVQYMRRLKMNRERCSASHYLVTC